MVDGCGSRHADRDSISVQERRRPRVADRNLDCRRAWHHDRIDLQLARQQELRRLPPCREAFTHGAYQGHSVTLQHRPSHTIGRPQRLLQSLCRQAAFGSGHLPRLLKPCCQWSSCLVKDRARWRPSKDRSRNKCPVSRRTLRGRNRPPASDHGVFGDSNSGFRVDGTITMPSAPACHMLAAGPGVHVGWRETCVARAAARHEFAQ